MRKRLICVYIAAILVFGICGCARTAVDAPVVETESVETENTTTESEEEETIEDTEIAIVEEEYVQSEEEMIPPESVDTLTKDYCSIDEFEDMDYYLFCDSWLSTGSGDGFKTKQSIISTETQTIEEANELYLEFRNKLPLDQEGDEVEEKDNALYVSPDCKWVITNKWSEHQTILTQMLFHEKEKIKETVDEIRTGYNRILIVKDGDTYKEASGEQYEKIMEFRHNDDYFDEGYSRIGEINAEGYLLAATKDEYSLLTIRWVEDGTELWRFSLQGVREEVTRIRDDIQEGDIVLVLICQFEGNENEGWLTVQAGPSSFFRIAYPSGEVSYLGEYMYSPRFSPDGKYIAYSSIDYDNGVGMDPDEYAQTPPGGIYVREVETGKTAYIHWEDYSPPEEYGLRSRGFNWIEKAAFEEYMNFSRDVLACGRGIGLVCHCVWWKDRELCEKGL